MLISQRIAKDPAFVRKMFKFSVSLPEVRQKIIRATKVIVGRNQMDFEAVPREMMERRNKKNTDEEIDKDIRLYREFARMPYPVMVFENDSGLKLVEEMGERMIRVTSIAQNGVLMPFIYTLDLKAKNKHTDDPEKWAIDFQMELPDGVKKDTAGLAEEAGSAALTDSAEIYEMILFMNISNKVTHQYVPSKRENSMVPKPLLPFYSYHIMDLFRDKKVFDSLADVDSFVRGTAEDNRRAHMVRGHWKTYDRNGVKKIYWWNPFMRSKKNLESKGFVDKGYRLRDDNETTTEE